jgi:hypothetical protein
VLWDAEVGAFHHSQRYDVRLVDRIGGGDGTTTRNAIGRLNADVATSPRR